MGLTYEEIKLIAKLTASSKLNVVVLHVLMDSRQRPIVNPASPYFLLLGSDHDPIFTPSC